MGVTGLYSLIDKFEMQIEKQQKELLIKSYTEARNTLELFIMNQYKAIGTKITFVDMQKFNRWEKLKKEIDETLANLEKNKFKIIDGGRKDVYQESFSFANYEVYRDTPLDITFAKLNKEVIAKGVENPVDLLKLPAVLERDRLTTINRLKNKLNQQLILGTSMRDTAQLISDELNIDYNKALKTVRTENHRVKEQASYDAGQEVEKEFDIKLKKQWLAVFDDRTREDHRKVDGKIVDWEDDFKVGQSKGKMPGNLYGADSASQNIYCRCKAIKVYDGFDKVSRTKLKTTNSNISYEDWKKGKLPKK